MTQSYDCVTGRRHDDLIRVIGDEDAPQDIMENQPPPGDFVVGDRIRVAWKRVRLVGQRRDTQTVAYANLEQRAGWRAAHG